VWRVVRETGNLINECSHCVYDTSAVLQGWRASAWYVRYFGLGDGLRQSALLTCY
jgi:hypothetical protein